MSDLGWPSAVLRRERAQRAVGRLSADVAAWQQRWLAAPGHGGQVQREASAQTGQLLRVASTLRELLARLAVRAEAIHVVTGFAAARAVDADLAMVERLWRYFADRFEQRRDPALAATLEAADDVIWACTACARGLTRGDAEVMPLPLAYLEPAYSLTAIPRAEPPLDLEASDRALARILAFLPVPLIGLPTSVVEEPWWLVLIAHEVGHHVQYDLEPGAPLIARTGDVLAAAAGVDGEAWRDWSREVFADAFAVAIIGGAAVDPIVELEWDSAAAMVEERGAYPPVLVRIALLGELARAVGGTARGPNLGELEAVARSVADAAARLRALAWLGRVRDVATALAAMPVAGSNLAMLAARNPVTDDAPLERVLRGADLGLDPGRLRPLRAAAAAFAVYRGLAATPDETARKRGRSQLRQRTAPLITQVRVPSHEVWRGSDARAAAADTATVADGIEALMHGVTRGGR